MPDSLPVSNVDFDPYRSSADRRGAHSSDNEGKEKSKKASRAEAEPKKQSKTQRPNQPGVGGQLDMEA